ncbi:YggT family protein [Clostridium manihotivorum]|jgi:YggT family protein|uniref:YggT family protein n=2 Tax=Clostridium manihotivorum TaxID=2320868 RepID=A0A410DSJ5_9CLOT|nr:YggT family protein [Clostridium manihotivorum]
MILIDAFSSVLFMGKENKVTYYIKLITAPILSPFQKLQNKITPNSPLDFSPMIAIIVLSLVQNILLSFI